QMVLNCVLAHTKMRRNLSICQALRYKWHDLLLALRKQCLALGIDASERHGRFKRSEHFLQVDAARPDLSAVHRGNASAQKLHGGRPLENTARARPECIGDNRIV